jgi:hypothetical protein
MQVCSVHIGSHGREFNEEIHELGRGASHGGFASIGLPGL